MQTTRCVDVSDNDLHDHCAHIAFNLRKVESIKDEIVRWWNSESHEASTIAREVRGKYLIRDDVLTTSLRESAVVSLCAILQDNNSKNLDEISKKFRTGALGKIVEKIYEPLWLEYLEFHKNELVQLKVNRNNLVAHLTKNKHINEVLSYHGEKVPTNDSETVDPELKTYNIITNSDICHSMNLFSDSSLSYLGNLLQLLRFAEGPEIKVAMETNVAKHLDDFRTNNSLK